MAECLAVFMPTLRGGGAERSLLTLAGGFAVRGFAVDLVLARAEGELLGDVPEGIRVIDLAAPRVLLALKGLVRYLRAERPRALLSAPKHANVVAILAHRLAGVDTRLVVSERNTLSAASANARGWGERLMPLLMRLAYPRADGVIAISRGVADDLSQAIRLARERIRVIYNPAVTPRVMTLMNLPLDHPWFERGEPPVILGAGRLAPQKDFSTLIRAFADLRARRPARLMILGEGPERRRLETLVAELGLDADVRLLGFIANPYPYMREAAVFVLSSRWEGFALVVAEALACGAPVVSTDCPSGPAEILEGGRWGRLVPVGDVPRLAEAIAAALDDPAPPRVAARLEAFSLERAIDGYLEVLLGDSRSEPAGARPATVAGADSADSAE